MSSAAPSPHELGAFERATAVIPRSAPAQEPGSAAAEETQVYDATVPPGWDIGGNVNGGLLAAMAGRAAAQSLDRPDVVTLTAHFLAPGRPGPLEVTVARHRTRGRHRTASVTLDSDRRVLAALVTCTDLAGADGPLIVSGTPLELPTPSECIATTVEPLAPPFSHRVDIRLHPEDAGFRDPQTRSGRAEMRGWARFHDDEPIDSFGLIQVADAFPPTTFNVPMAQGWTPTVELTVQIRSRPAPGWLRCGFRTRFISHGYLEADGEIWDCENRLVALSRQLALLPLEA